MNKNKKCIVYEVLLNNRKTGTGRQTDRQAGRQAGGRAGGRAGRQAGRQTDSRDTQPLSL